MKVQNKSAKRVCSFDESDMKAYSCRGALVKGDRGGGGGIIVMDRVHGSCACVWVSWFHTR